MTDNEAVDTTVDPAEHTKGVDADLDQTGDERAEAIDEFDGHLDGSGEESELPTPEPRSAGRAEPAAAGRRW
jgi:hypothetical protein